MFEIESLRHGQGKESKLFFYFRQQQPTRGNGFTKESWLLLITVNEDRFVMQTI